MYSVNGLAQQKQRQQQKHQFGTASFTADCWELCDAVPHVQVGLK
jgi:hypothetical protein